MKLTKIVNTATRTLNKVGFKFKKHSPEILLVAGVTGVITSTVMACKASTKVNDILEDTREQTAAIHDAAKKIENGEVLECADGSHYCADDVKKDLTIVYAQTAVKFVKLYGPSIIIGVTSIACILSSNKILRKRNVAIAAAYATVDKSFKDYRNRVVERFGKELDHELKYNIKAKEVEEVTVNEDGTETVTKKTINVADPLNDYSDYARIFDEGCAGWSKDPEFNLMFLRRQQDHANDILRTKGYLFLNEVYEMLGFQRTKAGQIVGWIYDDKHPIGDNYVDFGIYDIYSVSESAAERKRAFVNGYERNIILDFNVDGNILDNL